MRHVHHIRLQTDQSAPELLHESYSKQTYQHKSSLSLHIDGHEVRRAPGHQCQHDLLKTYTTREFLRLLFAENGTFEELPQSHFPATASLEQLGVGLVFDGH